MEERTPTKVAPEQDKSSEDDSGGDHRPPRKPLNVSAKTTSKSSMRRSASNNKINNEARTKSSVWKDEVSVIAECENVITGESKVSQKNVSKK